MEKKAYKTQNQKKTIPRQGLIDGLPNSFDTGYVIKTLKTCNSCKNLITENEISINEIIYTEEMDFFHKQCLKSSGITYQHYNSEDLSTPIVLDKKPIEEEKTK